MIRLIDSLNGSSTTMDRHAAGGENTPVTTPVDPFARVIGQTTAVDFLREIHKGVRLGLHGHPILFQGRSGNGKTTLAKAFSDAVNADFVRIDCGPELKSEELIARLCEIDSLAVVFCDEMQSMRKRVQEVLYNAVDCNQVPLLNGRRIDRCAQPTSIEPFILIGATNEPGRLLPALRNRMVNVVLEDYTPDDLRKIVEQKSQRMLLELSDNGKDLVVQACGGSPRKIMQILRLIEITSAAWQFDQQQDDAEFLSPSGGFDGTDHSFADGSDFVGQSLDEFFGDGLPDVVGGPLMSLTERGGGAHNRNDPDRSGSAPCEVHEGGVASGGNTASGKRIKAIVPDQLIAKALHGMGLDSAGLDATARRLLEAISQRRRTTAEVLATVIGLDMAYTREQLASLRARQFVDAAPGRGWCLTKKGEAHVSSLVSGS